MTTNTPLSVKSSEETVKTLNRWLIALVIFMVVYSATMLAIIDHKTERALQMQPVVLIDPATFELTSDAYTNLIPPSLLRSNIMSVVSTNESTNAVVTVEREKPLFEQKDDYEVLDFVVVNYVYVEAIVVEKLPKDQYRLMYKDHNHTLQFPILPAGLLLAPSAYNVASPVSLLVD